MSEGKNVKEISLWVGIIMMVAFAVSSLIYVQAYSKSVYPTRAFSVSGEGKAVVVPDIAQFSFSVITQGGKDLATLQNQNTEKANKVIAFLKDQKIDAKDIKTQAYSISPRYQYVRCIAGGSCPPPTIIGYEITQGVDVKIRDFSKIGALLSGVVQNGANSVSQLSFQLDDPQAAQNEARAEAIKQAQKKAQAAAAASGFRLGRLLGIDESFPSPAYRSDAAYGMGGAMEGVAKMPMPSVEPGSQEVIVNVYLRYEIK